MLTSYHLWIAAYCTLGIFNLFFFIKRNSNYSILYFTLLCFGIGGLTYTVRVFPLRDMLIGKYLFMQNINALALISIFYSISLKLILRKFVKMGFYLTLFILFFISHLYLAISHQSIWDGYFIVLAILIIGFLYFITMNGIKIKQAEEKNKKIIMYSFLLLMVIFLFASILRIFNILMPSTLVYSFYFCFFFFF